MTTDHLSDYPPLPDARMPDPNGAGWFTAGQMHAYIEADGKARATADCPPPTQAQLNSACMSYRHDFGLMDAEEQERLRWSAKEWLRAWQKEFEFRAPIATAEPTDAQIVATAKDQGMPETVTMDNGAIYDPMPGVVRTVRALRAPAATVAPAVTDDMVTRFLSWKLPANFSPDCGITFKRVYNETSPWGPQNHEPVGTNLLDADQARAMLEHVLATATATEPVAAWQEKPQGIEDHWLVADDGAILGHAGSVNMGGGPAYYARLDGPTFGQFLTLAQAKTAVERALRAPAASAEPKKVRVTERDSPCSSSGCSWSREKGCSICGVDWIAPVAPAASVSPEPTAAITKAVTELREAEWRSGMSRGDKAKAEYADHWAKILNDEIRAALSVAPEPTAEALRELVACKDLKESLKPTHVDYTDAELDEWRARSDEYNRRKPLAWAKARAALSGVAPEQPIGFAKAQHVQNLRERQEGWAGRADYLFTSRARNDEYTVPIYAALSGVAPEQPKDGT